MRVNAIAPGVIDTPMLRAEHGRRGDDPEELMATLASAHPVGRVGRPEEVAQAWLFRLDPRP